MVNPKTGKKQLDDYLHRGPPARRRKNIDIEAEEISTLPDAEELKATKATPEDERSELDGTLKHKH